MDNLTLDKCDEQIALCRKQKRDLEGVWLEAEKYAFNMFDYQREYDPTKVMSKSIHTLGTENLVNYGIRLWMSVVMSSPYGVEVTEAGARDENNIKKLAAQGINHVVNYLKQMPQSKRVQRELVNRALLFNFGMIYDWYDDYAIPYAKPSCMIPSHLDAYIDPAGHEPINDDTGPRFVAIRRWYYRDKLERIFGKSRVSSMKPGYYSKEEIPNTMDAQILDDKYPVIEWWGIDQGMVTITEQATRRRVRTDFKMVVTGEQIPPAVPSDLHESAIDEGKKQLVKYAQDTLDNEDIKDFPIAYAAIRDAGDFGLIERFTVWLSQHQMLLAEGIMGGQKPRFQGSIYRCEFQEGQKDWIRPPEPSPYKHGQLPFSVTQRIEGLEHYWVRGIICEALELQRQVEFLERCRNVHLLLQAKSPLIYDPQVMGNRYSNPESGRNALINDIAKGFKLIEIKSTMGSNPVLPQWLSLGALSMDVGRAIAEKKNSLLELFGATEVMRGAGPGAEASGKHLQIKVEQSSRPSIYMLQLLEGPLHRYHERTVSNVLHLSDEKWLQQICSPDQVEAIMAVREMGDFYTVVKVNMGSGMPTDYQTRFQYYSMAVQMGAITPIEFLEEMGIPIPQGAKERYAMQQEMMMQQQAQQQQQAAPQTTGSMGQMQAQAAPPVNMGSV